MEVSKSKKVDSEMPQSSKSRVCVFLRCRSGALAALCAIVFLLQIGFLSGLVAAQSGLEVFAAVSESRFGPETPANWQLDGKWTLTPGGALAAGDCRAISSLDLPENCLLEMIFDLPSGEKLEQKVTASISMGPADEETTQLTASAEYQRVVGEKPGCPYSVSVSGTGNDGQRFDTPTGGDMRPAISRQLSELDPEGADSREKFKAHRGWSGQTVSLGMAIDKGSCRLLVNGNVVADFAVALSEDRTLSVRGNGITLRAVRVLRGLPRKYVFLTGGGLAMLNGGSSDEPTTAVALARRESAVVEIDGMPFVVQGGEEGRLAALDVASESWRSKTWSEGTGMPMASLPSRSYAFAYLLLHLSSQDGASPAMGFGLRLPEMNGGHLKNIYVGEVPTRSCDSGVTVSPVPELGDRWFVARVPINSATLVRPGAWVYFTRSWMAGGGVPRPSGKPSALRVVACTVEESGIELSVQGNGLGNVYDELARPRLEAVLRNRTERPVSVAVTTELMPFERESSKKVLRFRIAPGQAESFDALPAPIAERGHYKVRVVADGGPAGRVDYRTNVAVLAPDLRMKVDSPFGCWGALWISEATEEQNDYLKVKSGIGFWMGQHSQNVRLSRKVSDDKEAEDIALSIGPGVRIFMLGWEHHWSREQTFTLPGVISEGRPEELSEELGQRIDDVVEQWRRIVKAVRKHRPGVKISLGNSAVNFSVPLLERGFKHGVEFDYFGTEEGIFSTSPEQPATAIGNVNWWARAVCEHFGFKDVPLFHSESVYFSTGPGFSRMAERTQAGYYVRTYLLGFPYDSIFGFTGAMVDSGNRYIYSNWGASGYCNQAPDCSPKLSYVAYATLTQLLDGAEYEGKLETGTTSVYALKFRRRKVPLCALWNLRGERSVTLGVKDKPEIEVMDAINRPVVFREEGDQVLLTISDLPVYVSGAEITAVRPGPNVEWSLPERTVLSPLDGLEGWQLDTEPDEEFGKPGEWTGVPRVMGKFDVTTLAGVAPVPEGKGAMSFTQKPLEGKHGLIPRYVSLTARPGREIPVPRGTTRLGVWVRGNSTWADVKFGVVNDKGERRVLLDDRTFSFGQIMDNFDGWRFLDTGPLDDPDIQGGRCKVDRIVIVMPEQQVYVDELLTTPRQEIAIWGLSAMDARCPDVNYLPW